MEEFTLIFDNTEKLLAELNYDYIHIMFDANVSTSVKNYILNLVNGKKVIQSVISSLAEEDFILNMPYKKESFVLAVGGLHLQSIAKYYAYMHYLPYGLIPAGEVAEYTFSCRAFIKDKYYCFYECEKPKFAHIFSTLFTENNVYNLYKVLTYKNICLFEREFCTIVFDAELKSLTNYTNIINNTKISVKEIIKIYAMLSIELDKQKTYDFLGLDYELLSLNCSNNIVLSLIDCQNVLVKFYTCMFKFDFFRISPDVNMHIKKIKDNFKISSVDASKKALAIFSESELSDIIIKLKAYKPHLDIFLEVCKNNFLHSKTDLYNKQLEIALGLAANFYPRKTLLRVAKELGYFENLVKDL